MIVLFAELLNVDRLVREDHKDLEVSLVVVNVDHRGLQAHQVKLAKPDPAVRKVIVVKPDRKVTLANLVRKVKLVLVDLNATSDRQVSVDLKVNVVTVELKVNVVTMDLKVTADYKVILVKKVNVDRNVTARRSRVKR